MYCLVLSLFSALFLCTAAVFQRPGFRTPPSIEEQCSRQVTFMTECHEAVGEKPNFIHEVQVNALDGSVELNVSATVVDSFCGFVSKHMECISSDYAKLEQCPSEFISRADAILRLYEGVCTTYKSDFKGIIPCANNNKVVLSEIYQCVLETAQEVASTVNTSDQSFLTYDSQCRIVGDFVQCFDKLRYCCEAGGEHGRRVLEFFKASIPDICLLSWSASQGK